MASEVNSSKGIHSPQTPAIPTVEKRTEEAVQPVIDEELKACAEAAQERMPGINLQQAAELVSHFD